MNSDCYIIDSVVSQIKSNCCGPDKSDAEKMGCISYNVDVDLDGTEDTTGIRVCRHHAACIEVIGEQCGVNTNYEAGYAPDGQNGHAWTESKIDTDGDGVPDHIYIEDGYNNIYYKCPIEE